MIYFNKNDNFHVKTIIYVKKRVKVKINRRY